MCQGNFFKEWYVKRNQQGPTHIPLGIKFGAYIQPSSVDQTRSPNLYTGLLEAHTRGSKSSELHGVMVCFQTG